MHKLLLFCFLLPLGVFAQDSTKTEKAVSVVPLITSSPLLGLGFGAGVSYLYRTDESSSKSQLSGGGQYSVTDSYVLYLDNKAFFKGNKIRSNTKTSFSNINNEFVSDGIDVSYNVKTLLLTEVLLFEVVDKSYLGGLLSYKELAYKPNDEGGEDFLYDNGVEEEKTAGIGAIYSFDSRENKYYPSDAWLVDFGVNAYPTWLGANQDYYQMVANARFYDAGFKKGDVWAWQLYGQFSSKRTTDNGLPTLSGKSLLRGFPAGQYKALYMTGAQTEYRYQVGESRFRLISFIGVANLAGGSYGSEGRSRDDNGWYSAGGVGARYAIQARTGVDLRLDLVYTSKNDKAIYLKLNQAF